MRGLWSTLLLVVVLAGLGAYIYFVDSKRPEGGVETKEKVFTVEPDKIDELRITSDNQTSVLKKENGTWRLTEPEPANADQNEVSSIASGIAALEVNRIVDENAPDLSQYGLATPRIQVAYKGPNGAAGELHLGEKSPTQSDVYAVRPGQKRVFLVQAFHESTFNKKPFDLRDKRILMFEREKADRVEITQGTSTLELVKGTSDWEIKQPVQARGDYGAIEGLLTRLSSATMTKLVEGPAAIEKPAITVTVGAGSNRASLAVAEEAAGEVQARDLSRPLVFVVESSLLTDLKKTADDYRDKDVFQFRPFNLSALRISRGADTFEFKKVPGSGETPDKWQRITGSTAADVETAKMDDLLTKLNALRAQSFLAKAAGEAAVTVAASYDNGKFERARLGKSGADAFSIRDGEPGAAKLDDTAYDDMVKALDAVVK